MNFVKSNKFQKLSIHTVCPLQNPLWNKISANLNIRAAVLFTSLLISGDCITNIFPVNAMNDTTTTTHTKDCQNLKEVRHPLQKVTFYDLGTPTYWTSLLVTHCTSSSIMPSESNAIFCVSTKSSSVFNTAAVLPPAQLCYDAYAMVEPQTKKAGNTNRQYQKKQMVHQIWICTLKLHKEDRHDANYLWWLFNKAS